MRLGAQQDPIGRLGLHRIRQAAKRRLNGFLRPLERETLDWLPRTDRNVMAASGRKIAGGGAADGAQSDDRDVQSSRLRPRYHGALFDRGDRRKSNAPGAKWPTQKRNHAPVTAAAPPVSPRPGESIHSSAHFTQNSAPASTQLRSTDSMS
jgi:hypothetical protein